MSGSGGFYKYRCKHFLTYNCNNWVYVNGAACACCLVEGRDEDTTPWGTSQPDSLTSPIVINTVAGSCRDLIPGSFGHGDAFGVFGDNPNLSFKADEDDPAPVPYQELPRLAWDGTWNPGSE